MVYLSCSNSENQSIRDSSPPQIHPGSGVITDLYGIRYLRIFEKVSPAQGEQYKEQLIVIVFRIYTFSRMPMSKSNFHVFFRDLCERPIDYQKNAQHFRNIFSNKTLRANVIYSLYLDCQVDIYQLFTFNATTEMGDFCTYLLNIQSIPGYLFS